MLRISTILLVKLTFLFALTSPVFSQSNALKIKQLPPEFGWTNVAINDILQDDRGFLWIATWSGLAKYDGYNMKMYHQSVGDPNGLKSNKITCLFEDSKGQLWVGTTYSGFYRYDRLLDRFIQYTQSRENMNSLSNSSVWAITEDKYGFLWIGTEKGLNRFDPETETFIHFEASESDDRSLSDDFIYSLEVTASGDLWIGAEIGLNRLIRKEDGTPDFFMRYSLAPDEVSEDDFLRHNFIRRIQASHHNNSIWVGTSIGLKKITYSSEDITEISHHTYYHNTQDQTGLSHSFVADILEEEDGDNVWVATYDGLNLLDTKSGKFQYFYTEKEHYSLSNNIVKSLYKDCFGVLWVGTDKGINNINLNAKPFQSIQFSAENSITSCVINAKERNGLWVGTSGGGLIFLPLQGGMIDKKNSQFYTLGDPVSEDLADFISDIVLDKNGWLWVATKGAGVFKVREADIPDQGGKIRQAQQFTKEDFLEDDYVMSLFAAADGGVWLGYWDNGLSRYDPDTDSFQHYTYTQDYNLNLQAFPIVHMTETIAADGTADLWVGTRGGGVSQLQLEEETKLLHLKNSFIYSDGQNGEISNNSINCFYQDDHDRLWIGTENGLNLFKADENSFDYFLAEDGFLNGSIQSIIGVDGGGLWVSTKKGISHLQFEGSEVIIKNFDTSDGLHDVFFNDDAVCKLADGQLVFGDINGLNVFNPAAIRVDETAPEIAITDFKLFNKSVPIGPDAEGRTILGNHISETKVVELTHRDNVFSIEFVGLQFGEPRNIQYAYKLEGFDLDWVYTDASQRIAYYTNLPYDEYRFQVKAANEDGIWSLPVGFALNVKPPIWLTKGAMLFYAFLFGALLYGVRKLTKMRAEFSHSLQLEKLEREKLEEVNQLKLQFFTNISHELRTPLTLIISPLEAFIREQQVDKKMHAILNRMHHNANRLLTMINQLLDIRKSESGQMKLSVVESDIIKFTNEIVLSFQPMALSRNIQLDFEQEKEQLLFWFDRTQMEKVLYNLLSNAMKFTEEGGQIKCSIQQTPAKSLLIQVQDSGQGIGTADIDLIFDRFYQVEQVEGKQLIAGSGIGLSLCKSIVEKHHGKIWAESAIGQGSVFSVELPIGADHYRAGEKVEDYLGSEDIIHYRNENEALPPETAAELGAVKILDKPKILLVEDNPDIRAYLRESLEEECTIKEAANGEAGLKAALKNPPDLIIADISMPKMDGIAMCRAVKTNIDTSHVPVILLTARTSLIYKINGLETGADDYITKPFNLQLLKARVNNLIQSRKNLQKRFSKGFDFNPSELVLNSLDEELLSKIKLLVERHIDDSEFSVEQLANALYMSRMQLYRKLKALTGESPNKIIRSIRMKRAAQLLESKQYNVSDVTYMVGYNDLKSFREQFKKEFGVSPSNY